MVGLLTREKTKADAPVLATEPNEEDAKASVAARRVACAEEFLRILGERARLEKAVAEDRASARIAALAGDAIGKAEFGDLAPEDAREVMALRIEDEYRRALLAAIPAAVRRSCRAFVESMVAGHDETVQAAQAAVAEHQATKVGAMQEGGRETQATRTALPAGGVMRSGWKPPAVAAWETEAQAREQRLAELVARRDAIRKLIVPPTGAEGREAYEADAARLARATIAEGGAS